MSTIKLPYSINKVYKLINDDLDKFLKFEIASSVENCDDIFNKLETMSFAWHGYKKSITSDGKSLINPKEFFNTENLITKNLKWKHFYRALPGIITSGGLLITFICILKGLIGIDPQKIETINTLIQGLGLKFIFSIIALLLSIAFVCWERCVYSEINRKVLNLNQKLVQLFPVVTQKDILINLSEKVGLLSQTTGVISERLNNQSDAINALATRMKEDSFESMKQMVEMFQTTLSENTSKHFAKISDNIIKLEEVITYIHDSHEEFVTRMEKVNNISENSLLRQEQIFEEITNVVASSKNKFEKFDNLLSSNNELFDKLFNTIGELAYASDQFSSVTPEMVKIKDSINELTTNLNNSVSYFKNVTNEMTGDKLEVMLSEFKQGIKDSLIEIQVGLNEDSQYIKDNFEWYQQQLEHFVENAKNVIDNVHSSMGKYTEETDHFLNNYDELMRRTIGTLNNHIDNLEDGLKNNLSELNDNFNILNKTLDKFKSKNVEIVHEG